MHVHVTGKKKIKFETRLGEFYFRTFSSFLRRWPITFYAVKQKPICNPAHCLHEIMKLVIFGSAFSFISCLATQRCFVILISGNKAALPLKNSEESK